MNIDFLSILMMWLVMIMIDGDCDESEDGDDNDGWDDVDEDYGTGDECDRRTDE